MELCFLRGLLLVALTARALEDGKWSYFEAEGGTRAAGGLARLPAS